MKKIILFVVISFAFTTSFAQKKKIVKTNASLANVDNLVAEVKAGNFQLIIDGKEAIIVKHIDSKFNPSDVKLTGFMATGTKLYILSWTEKTQNKTDLKLEDITVINSNIYEIKTKKLVFTNSQLTNNISEKVFLDGLKQASENQQKIRKEGFEFVLNPDGSVVQKNKKQENKLVFDSTKLEYVPTTKKK